MAQYQRPSHLHYLRKTVRRTPFGRPYRFPNKDIDAKIAKFSSTVLAIGGGTGAQDKPTLHCDKLGGVHRGADDHGTP